ncbi:hypothetical protein GCM10010168_68010 [Actinoplanes ianthinogenes]|uniref:Fibronectin type-III domain-containing protein n=1 Tax=Actinoplanes ianthinogenes TaxID=122358 RepID=A0ABN6CIL3_9ACTN|nr:hypothetical protein [Actinoplanes ianthinogenes]BCJ43998.1 hypothetical protein Aiant_46550 [Actinoplanes ianthinogenes]GGR39670.1 hypothetical protein GCM10010168_68010 [Actinoplanes ianthinogenes]
MRRVKTGLVLAAALVTAGCGSGSGSGTTPATASAPSPGGTWSVLVSGSATPSPTPSLGSARPTAGVTASLPSANPSCTKAWPATDPVLIPVAVTPIAGGFKVEWPRQYDSNYRVTAVPQKLVSGAQPAPVWKNVPAGTGCTISATITGLIPGAPYVVWLDAPNTGYEADGTRHLYSGRSGVVYPK